MRTEISAQSRGVIEQSPILSVLPRSVRVPYHPLRAVVVGWLTAFVPSILLAALVATLLPTAEQPKFDVDGALAVLMLVVFAPVFETLIMGSVLLLLLRLASPSVAVLVSAAGWGVAHSLIAPGWGLVIWWPFLVFSTLFVTWRQRSLAAAFALPMLVHGFQNLPSALLLASGQLS